MLLVLDTNVIVSAFINPSGKPSHIVKMILGRKAEICYNSIILSEYENVMQRPKFSEKLDTGKIRSFIDLLRLVGTSSDPLPSKIKFNDESDRIFYDTAKESGSLLITGNIKHYPKESFILLPADFLSRIKNKRP